jgi:hypothetical protein
MTTDLEHRGQDLSRHAIANFLRYAADALSLIDLTHDAARVLVNIRDQLAELDVEPDNDEGSRRQTSIEERAAVAERELEKDFPLLNSHTIVGLWGALEACVDDVAEGWIGSDEAQGAKETLSKMRVQLGGVLYLDPDERWRWLIEQVKKEQNSSLTSGVGQFESLLGAIGFGGDVQMDVRKTMFLVKAVRNLIAHNGGRVDRKFTESVSGTDLQIGQPLQINTRQAYAAVFAMVHYVESLAERKSLTRPSTDSPKWLPSPAQVLADFETVLRKP